MGQSVSHGSSKTSLEATPRAGADENTTSPPANMTSRKSVVEIAPESTQTASSTMQKEKSVRSASPKPSETTTELANRGRKSQSVKIIAPVNMHMDLKYQASEPVQSQSNPITKAQRAILRECWTNCPHTDIGLRIYNRVLQKKPEIRDMYDRMERQDTSCAPSRSATTGAGTSHIDREHMGPYSWNDEARDMTKFLETVLGNLENISMIIDESCQWGSRFTRHKHYGFKPAFWLPFSDSITTECVYLDQAVHPPADVIDAWSTLVTLIMSNMREGYYGRLRYKRKTSARSLSFKSSKQSIAKTYQQYVQATKT